ncbi:MAG: hypothetical protein IKL82_05240 [Clostridia bacterium]|nr:hypothetical protein [Clostridia bacterium]
MGILEITRNNSLTGSDAFRAYQVYVDGNKIEEIKSGETKSLKLEDGAHVLQLKIDWCTSKKLSFLIEKDKVKRVKCYPAGKGFMSTLNLIFKKDEYITVEIV